MAATATAITLGLAGHGWAAPPTPQFGPAIDPYAAYDPQSTCDPTAKPGVVDFKNLVLAAYPSTGDLGITRACSSATSEHMEGRAWDWAVSASTQRATADDLLNWLLATDQYGNQHARLRRLGIMYMIWDSRIWAAYQASSGWRPYACDGTDNDCHRNHVHFSFSWDGALERTTWWTVGGTTRTVGDYDADRHTDLALYRRDCGDGSSWWVKSSASGATINGGTKFGGCTDIPAPGDYDGDGYTDLALYRPDCTNGSTWWIRSSRTGATIRGGTKFGGCTDIPAPGDYDGDGHSDLALYRRDCTNGSSWWVLSSRTGATINGGTKFGGCTDIPAPGDYDGDRYADLALYRRDCSDGSSWWVRSSRTGATINGGTKFGGCTDIPATSG